MRKWLPLLFLIVALLVPQSARGQEISLSAIEVDIWPEYDQPAVLVIYRIMLAADLSLPLELALRIPAAVGEPNAVAARQMDGALISIDYQREVSGEWAEIHFTAITSQLQLEYYDPTLVKDGAQRSYVYTWPGDYSVDSMTIQVQEPLNATGLRIAPSLGEGVDGQDGLTYYNSDIGAIPAGQTLEISLSYRKADDLLSVEGLQVRPSAPIPENTAESLQSLPFLPWLLGFAGVVLIVGGVWWYWRTGRQVTGSRRRRPSSRPLNGGDSAIPPAVAAQPTERQVYCHQCGQRSQPGDIYCRTCGARLRVE
ncbi:MAG: zinc ribbon domain-containing protein [Anaerolineales bacterium]|nr:zinc ribbon domain-containing protein [Anaerolineales bacterium]